MVCEENEIASQILPSFFFALTPPPTACSLFHKHINCDLILAIHRLSVEGKRGEKGCRTWTISLLQDARRQSHEVTESIAVTSFTLRLILQFCVLNCVASLKEKMKGRVFQAANKRLTTWQLQ